MLHFARKEVDFKHPEGGPVPGQIMGEMLRMVYATPQMTQVVDRIMSSSSSSSSSSRLAQNVMP